MLDDWKPGQIEVPVDKWTPVWHMPDKVGVALAYLMERDNYEVLQSVATKIANHRLCRQSWGDARVGFAAGHNGNLYIAISGENFGAAQAEELQNFIIKEIGYKESVFIGGVKVCAPYVQRANQQRDFNDSHGGSAGAHAGCAEKKLLSSSIANRWLVAMSSMAVYKMTLANDGSLLAKRDTPCQSCEQCMADYFYAITRREAWSVLKH